MISGGAKIESVLALIESVKDYKVLFIGDSITDEYHYVEALGKSPKEHVISCRYLKEEVFHGGTAAAASHARNFCKQVDTFVSPTAVRKVRFVDLANLRKVSEIHYGACDQLEGSIPSGALCASSAYDAVVVTDFGHGAIGGDMIQKLCQAPFVAVAAQTNSSNIGFNLITKYPKADYIVIDEPEARLAAADRDSHIEDVIRKLAYGRCGKFIVTHGPNGAYGYENGKFHHCKSHTDLVRDTMGAGDAFFAVTAPMAKTGKMEDLLLIGNAAGALKTQIIGHRKSITKEALTEYLWNSRTK